MPYTVAHSDPAAQNEIFHVYLRLLRQRDIDWTNAERAADPGTENRWLHVWHEESDAQSFCDAIRKDTNDNEWHVRELDDATPISQSPLQPLIIRMRRHSLGAVFVLDPTSKGGLDRRFPGVNRVSNVEIHLRKRMEEMELEEAFGTLWDQIVTMLCGLSPEQLAELGGYEMFAVQTHSVVRTSVPVLVA